MSFSDIVDFEFASEEMLGKMLNRESNQSWSLDKERDRGRKRRDGRSNETVAAESRHQP